MMLWRQFKRDVENKLKEYEQWDSESTRYELKELATGILVYSLKPNDPRGEPTHFLCPNCFHKRQKSIMVKPAVDNLNYRCHACGFDVIPVSQAAEWNRAMARQNAASEGGYY